MSEPAKPFLVFIWDNYGPYHMDRMNAIQCDLGSVHKVIGIELYPESPTYSWMVKESGLFEKRTIFRNNEPRSIIGRLRMLFRQLPPLRDSCVFVCHYEMPTIFMLAVLMRLRGARVIMMNNSKFDDKPRHVFKELVKVLFLIPYHGVLSNAMRSRQYWEFLGKKSATIRGGYNTVSLDRIRDQAGVPPAPDGVAFRERHFTCIARLVPKKNLTMLLQAYAIYHRSVTNPRALHLCGTGSEEAELRLEADKRGISGHIVFRGWLQDDAISRTLGQSLVLLLPSIEEQFGNVVIEAQAMGLPVIVSENCGARDQLVRSGVNGFVIEPDNPEGMAYFMTLLSEEETLWRRMCEAATDRAPLGDVQRFVEGVKSFVE
jgi:glycosyltransferase involved in cell wall biosynthesis